MKTVKTLRQYLTWNILNAGGFPVHMITMYIPPYQNDEVKELQNRVISMIRSIKQKCNKQRIIVMGDFNFHLKDFGKRLKKEGLMQSIPEGVGTHTKGNQLDQIFSNAETREWKLDQLRLTDHNLVQVKLVMKFTNNDLKMTDKEKTVRISDVRKQCWKTFIEEKQDMRPEDLEMPIRNCFESKLEKQSKAKNWYQQPPYWAVRNNIKNDNSAYQDTKQQWNEAIRDMEHCLDRNDLKGFFYLVKRLTKNQKQSQPIKGLTIEQERIQPGEQTLEKVVEFYNKLFADDRIQDQARKKQSDTVMNNEQNGEQFCNVILTKQLDRMDLTEKCQQSQKTLKGLQSKLQ
ncbi:hypothetical protein OXYTRIMIC_793 [Oxytricha trifallax]|uniref:Uncharacterized protein n=1 Tax=Oxytricha trifallax TaxID=1172189 RepID=A0A073I0K0_9SPIT|nr:hypothetical protein OXYTRIMIC_793 [Oxytricha trifallax]